MHSRRDLSMIITTNLKLYSDLASAPSPSSGFAIGGDAKRTARHGLLWSELVLAIVLLAMLAFVVNVRITKSFKEKKKQLNNSTVDPSRKVQVRQEQEERHPGQLVFFVEEEERFKLENLLDAGADMQNQNYCSSLYKVQLKKNDKDYALAVKRLKKLQATCEEFERMMAIVGKLNHPNILPLLAYSCQGEERLLIYKYQNKGSLLSLMESYVEGKRDFPWKLRLSVAVGMARGLDHIYRRPSSSSMIIPHGNIKPSNILLNENEEALISEYGHANLLVDPDGRNGYTAPEKCISEQGDVFSFGVILLELLTGKIVEKSRGLDLPKWVKAMVREEWTGEVFDKEIGKVGMYAFPLLNVSLKCVAHFPENRPSMAEVFDKIMGVVNEQVEDISLSSCSSMEDSSSPHLLYSVAEES